MYKKKHKIKMYLSLNEINSNFQYAPIGYEVEFKSRIQKDKSIKEIISFFENPFLLTPKYIKTSGRAGGGQTFKLKNGDNFFNHHELRNHIHLIKEQFEHNDLFDIEDDIRKLALDHFKIKSQESSVWDFMDKRELEFIPHIELSFYHKSYKKDDERTTYHFTRGGKLKVPKYTLQKDFRNIGSVKVDDESPLKNVANCFNIIQKEFKIMNEKTRDYYTRYFTTKPFFQFEEIGLEILYARKGYAIDGKRLPSFNRGSVWSLKRSLKENKIKQKGLTKKDDIIKALMKI